MRILLVYAEENQIKIKSKKSMEYEPSIDVFHLYIAVISLGRLIL